MKVDKVYHRKDAVWHFTVVGRPPAEDSSFGYLIHELVRELTPQEFPGLRQINAVDAAGVHPLLLAIGSERYMPFRERKPEEILTIANRILGSGQTSLAKYLFIAAHGDDPNLDTHDLPRFFEHVLSRVDLTRDLHFQTKTTIDTLDYSGTSWNGGSKLVVACCGKPIRELSTELPKDFKLPIGFSDPDFPFKGIMTISAPKYNDRQQAEKEVKELISYLENFNLEQIPLIVVVDDSKFTAATINNFVWVTFTRSNPSHDIHGVRSFVEYKHWGCRGSLVIDARIKPHHAPVLEVPKKVTDRVDQLFSSKGALGHLKI